MSFLKGLLNRPSMERTSITKSPSMDDFSMGASHDMEEEMQGPMPASPAADVFPGSSPPKSPGSATRTNEWQSTFNPGRNFNPSSPNRGRNYYDHVDPQQKTPTTWEYILKSNNVQQLNFAQLDKNADGVIDASDLRSALGPQANVEQLIKQADKNGDGKIDYYEFCEMMKAT